MNLKTLVLRYSFFAALATVANIGAQRFVFDVLGDNALIPAILVGTAVGLVLKYILDKRWIFYDLNGGISDHGKKFSAYTAMGIVTTFIFWGMETTFWLIWRTDMMREVGAILGLAIGYVVKFHLDRRFVFTNSMLSVGASR
ncbi:GtrA-like protein [Ruegeria halocynthiae]|uniref:GtrA-like protein n=1 Tax=Ruegeria halocynthiae TaxID=985054 RepID=A0A1H2Y4Z3_9RHOB|nr:GtrA family protein [Ruegeria halocynthiae]SDX00065.1 GtrA-like protein [Ruegeria halocynthiae]